jgi:hypothetical protein
MDGARDRLAASPSHPSATVAVRPRRHAALNLIGVAVLAVVFWRLGSFGKWRHPTEAGEPAEADA